MDPERITVDLEDRIAEIETTLEERRDDAERIKSESADLDRDSEEYGELDAEYANVMQDVKELEKALTDARDAIGDWGGSEFRVEEFTWGRQGQRNDLYRADAIQSKSDDPRANLSANKIRTVQVGVVDTPPEAPDSPSEWPPVVGEYLHDRIEALNTTGEADLEDFSLAAALDDES